MTTTEPPAEPPATFAPPVPDTGDTASRSVSGFEHGVTSLQAGAIQLIPVPFVDDWVTTRLRRRMVRSVLRARGISFDRDVPRIAARWDRGSTVERLRRGTLNLAVKPLRKMFRTVFFWLAIHRAVRTAVETYLLGRFWNHPELGVTLASSHLSEATARNLASVFGSLAERIDARLTRDAVRRLWRLLRSTARRARGQVAVEDVADALEAEQPGLLAEFDQAVTDRLRPGGHPEGSVAEA